MHRGLPIRWAVPKSYRGQTPALLALRVLEPLQTQVLKESHQDGKGPCFPKEYDTEKKGHERLAAKSYSSDTVNQAVREILPFDTDLYRA